MASTKNEQTAPATVPHVTQTPTLLGLPVWGNVPLRERVQRCPCSMQCYRIEENTNTQQSENGKVLNPLVPMMIIIIIMAVLDRLLSACRRLVCFVAVRIGADIQIFIADWMTNWVFCLEGFLVPGTNIPHYNYKPY